MEENISPEYMLNEQQVEERIEEMLWDVVVRGFPADFGLSWTTGSADYVHETVIGCWLNRFSKVKKAAGLGRAIKSNLHFFLVNDKYDELIQLDSVALNNDDYDDDVKEIIKFSEIDYIIVSVKYDPYRIKFTLDSNTKYEKKAASWTLSPVQDNDAEVVISFVACLKYRAQLFSDRLLLARNKALKAIIFAQSHYRRKKARKKYERRLARRQGVMNILSSTVNAWFFGGDGYVDSDDSDYENARFEDAMGQTQVSVADQMGLPIISTVAALMQDFYQAPIRKTSGKSFSAAKSEISTQFNNGRASVDLHNSARVLAGRLQTKYNLPELLPGEVEIEIFEVQKWEITAKKWSNSFWGDRLLKERKKFLNEVTAAKIDPTQWHANNEFQLDLSGLNSKGCGKDGWVYSKSLRGLIMEKTFDRVNTKPSTSMIYRRRRWFQRRQRQKPPGAKPQSTPVLWHGYIGMKKESTGRWETYYFALTSGLMRENRVTGISLVQFSQRIVNFYDFVNAEGEEFNQKWAELRLGKDIKMYNLEGGSITMKKRDKKNPNSKHFLHVKLSQFPSGFVRLSKLPKQKTKALELCCESGKSQKKWFRWIYTLIKKQDKKFTLTRIQVKKHQVVTNSKNQDYNSIPSFDWSVLDRVVGCDLDSFVYLIFYDSKFQSNLHNQLSSREYEVKKNWPDIKEFIAGARKEVHYILPKQKNTASQINVGTIPRTRVIEKFKVESFDKGKGFHMTSSLTFPDVAFGNLFQCLVRTVVTSWRGVSSRITISMQIDSHSEDENIKNFVESLMRAHMLQYYVQAWMPLVGKAVKYTMNHQRQKKRNDFELITPTGLNYKEV
eukprot:snap_masked-scaffold_11-processed-gene-10.46-mRNA-1 protein AED:1.00 eAED:1.00 QI:0/0/0/0/1/1/2/0/837